MSIKSNIATGLAAILAYAVSNPVHAMEKNENGYQKPNLSLYQKHESNVPIDVSGDGTNDTIKNLYYHPTTEGKIDKTKERVISLTDKDTGKTWGYTHMVPGQENYTIVSPTCDPEGPFKHKYLSKEEVKKPNCN